MPIVMCVVLGLGIGLVSGLLGIGGGVLLIPLLMWLADFDQPRAAGVTLAILAVPVVLPAVLEYYRNGTITANELWIALWIAIGFAIGGWSGAHVRPFIPTVYLRVLFGLLLLYIAVRFLLATDYEVMNAAVGVCVLAGAWLVYWRLKALGHKHLRRPELKIEGVPRPEPAEGDYYI